MNIEDIEKLIPSIPDFPKRGIQFKDMTPALENPQAFQSIIDLMAKGVSKSTTKIVAIESRGFILGAALALKLNCGLVLVRKPGKLPRKTIGESYTLEYGEDRLEIHADALNSSDQIIIVDDVLATGGTAQAVENICRKMNVKDARFVFLMEIEFLKGRGKLGFPIHALISI